jgi:UDP-N-acetylmuramyl pentapeptide phosphotransferase/UDP-N-acetylglucosamine-1-phosphate transferase
MDFSVLWYIPVFIVSLVFVAIVIPSIVKVANKINLFDVQDGRKVHQGNVPRLGGISFLPAILFTLLVVVAVMTRVLPSEIPSVHYVPITEIMMAAAGCVILYLTGIMDDVIGVSYRSKFVLQILAAALICCSGLYISNLYGVFGIHHLPALIGVPLTIVIIVFIINSINLIDGIDGLASGLCIFGGIGYALMFNHFAMDMNLVLAVSMLGVLLMFYLYNVFGKPGVNKTFMGDTGSLTMGFLLAYFAIKLCCFKDFLADEPLKADQLFVYGISVIIIPVLDVFRVFFARILDGRSPFYPDKRHIHHKFLALGFSMRQSRWAIFGISFLFLAMNILLSFILEVNINLVILADAVVWILMNMYISSRVRILKLKQDEIAVRFEDLGKDRIWNRKRTN